MTWDWHCWAILALYLAGLVLLLAVHQRRIGMDLSWLVWPLVLPGAVILTVWDAVRWVRQWRADRIARG